MVSEKLWFCCGLLCTWTQKVASVVVQCFSKSLFYCFFLNLPLHNTCICYSIYTDMVQFYVVVVQHLMLKLLGCSIKIKSSGLVLKHNLVSVKSTQLITLFPPVSLQVQQRSPSAPSGSRWSPRTLWPSGETRHCSTARPTATQPRRHASSGRKTEPSWAWFQTREETYFPMARCSSPTSPIISTISLTRAPISVLPPSTTSGPFPARRPVSQ